MTALGVNLSHVPDSGVDDPLSEAVLALACAAAELVESPTDTTAAVTALAILRAGIDSPRFTALIDALLDILETTDRLTRNEETSNG